MNRKQIVLIALLAAAIGACSKDPVPVVFEGFQKPDNFPQPVYHFETNPITKDGFELGRTLFYDPILSADNTISCGSCHIQTSAFTHHGHVVSHGILDRQGIRNSPPIMNLAWNTSFMWDGGIADMDLQSIAPITNHVEMDETMDRVLEKLRKSASYPGLFKKAYGSEEVTTDRFLKSISQFMAMCVSSNSKYDSVLRRQGAMFTKDELEGYEITRQKCTPCHQEPLFTDHSFRNNGIAISGVNDPGRYSITEKDSDRYKFKVPSLRNLAYTAPYMHDGRFFTIEAVLDHYSNGVQNTRNLDTLFQKNVQPGIPLTANDKIRIKAFLATLNDKVFITDKRFAEQ